MDKKHLRMSGLQWQYRRKYPAAVAKLTNRNWKIHNLGTDSLKEAQRLRNRLNVEFDDALVAVRTSEAEQLAEYQAASDHNREGLWYHYSNQADDMWHEANRKGDEKGKQDVIDWMQRITGVTVPIDMNLPAWQQQAPAVQSTQLAREVSLKRFMRTSGAKDLDDVDRRAAGRYVDALVAEGLAEITVNGHVNTLSAYWKFMVRKGICESNPWEKQSLPGHVKQQRIAWEKHEVRTLIHKADSKALLHAMMTAALMGLRSAEITRLTVADSGGGLCRILKGKTPSAKRTLPWHSQLQAMIDGRLEGKEPQEFLFHELKGNEKALPKLFPKFRDKVFPELREAKEGQSPKTFHSFRHYWVTERMQAGCAPHLVSECVGHKNKGVTLGVYHHGMTADQAREIVEASSL